ncbi:MAG: GIY-YIG nuclease family protein [Candidatus Symbiobacter sp.]|nr:GIY-YIG nuclease family protein [Candidatus Symbiobacter sp.]
MKYQNAAVYIMASKRNGTIYVGVTNDLPRRVSEHRQGLIAGFTQKYGCKILVWYESQEDMPQLISREKMIKGWTRRRKLALIEEANPEWRDLYFDLIAL